jgi:hypothetical protein
MPMQPRSWAWLKGREEDVGYARAWLRAELTREIEACPKIFGPNSSQ